MKIKKAVLTGGGRATRLHPITTTINKHLLPLANKPMIFHAIEKAVEAGITEIFINMNPGETELQKYIGDGGHWGIRIRFYEQTGGPQGVAHVVKEAERFIGHDPFLFYLSDNILLGSLKEMVDSFTRERYDCMLALSQVEDPERFGVPVFDDRRHIIDVLEKPANPPNNFAVTGVYLYGHRVFFDAFDHIEKSARGEYEISSIHSYLLHAGKKVGYREITGWWKDTGKVEDLLVANRLLLDQLEPGEFSNHGTVHHDTQINGNVRIGIGTQTQEGVVVHGPVIIGENCVLRNCAIGPHVTIGPGTEIRGSTIFNSIILDNVVIDGDIHIRDSLIGKKVEIRKQNDDAAAGHRMIVGDKTVIEI
ncbi:MAG TPA: glucose-1-phosphate thymidylyltransferase [Candidatus Magasanikbacteria bacterium]|nr:MAG: glucose-1-phosphate thymidylyltransferase [Candidatus Magasanikbacteria bacterium RIFCSPLOWO2_02_FULL_47_16]OGH79755.1 MAG: glucose-1-phosphate thymidylyltransferase [Candidatus Magasanikbacteria bacterium RIFCSPHIGHO2_02_FULL_48_18]OGH82541.1 MAG: glucose-1-phosphate thymidylyltransferase [Candidatus Magasanikbacteria bacterium RIFCSPLOWO2_12_FULL_47_9b]HAZ28159.1 glucose-1-phosphate thymidylyltransferase [Candidatus Magasanikbacteria bacterium]